MDAARGSAERRESGEMDPKKFMGVVYAIACEVENDQRLPRGELLGEVFIRCTAALGRFTPTKSRTFARYAYSTVKPSLARDIARERRKGAGLKSTGEKRSGRKVDVRGGGRLIKGEMAVSGAWASKLATSDEARLPEWWPLLTRQQRSIVLMKSQGWTLPQIAKLVELPTGVRKSDAAMWVEDELARVRAILLESGIVVDDPRRLDDLDDEAAQRGSVLRPAPRRTPDPERGWWSSQLPTPGGRS